MMGVSMCFYMHALLFFCQVCHCSTATKESWNWSQSWFAEMNFISHSATYYSHKVIKKEHSSESQNIPLYLKSKVRMRRKKRSQQISIKQEGKPISFSSISLMHIPFRLSLKCGLEALQLFSGCLFMTHIPDWSVWETFSSGVILFQKQIDGKVEREKERETKVLLINPLQY